MVTGIKRKNAARKANSVEPTVVVRVLISIAITIILVALTPMFGQTQAKPDWRYWRTFNLEMGLGAIEHYIDINSVRRTNNVWEVQQMDVTRFFRHYKKMQINCSQYTINFMQAVRVEENGRTTDITSQMARMEGLVADDAKPYCQLFATGNFRKLPRLRQQS